MGLVATTTACEGSDPPCTGTECVADAGGEDGGRCANSDDCDDGLFCNGDERCVDGSCTTGDPACRGACDEDTDSCSSGCTEAEADPDRDDHDSFACDGDDCDDSDDDRFPGNPEVCDDLGHDEDCNPATIGPDRDGDGFVWDSCSNTLDDGTEYRGRDCNDGDASIHPDAAESCNGADDDCDGEVDESVLLTYYRDADGDGFGVEAETAMGCTLPGGWSFQAGDCAPMVPAVHPGAAEICADGIDNDCNGIVDDGEGCDCTTPGETISCGGGSVNEAPAICRRGTKECVTGGIWGECMGSTDPTTETCNGLDDDCNGDVDEGGSRECVLGDSKPCTICSVGRVIRVEGTQTCGAPSCTWGACQPEPENTCDGSDDDCDGYTDELFAESAGSQCRVPVYRYYRNSSDSIWLAVDSYFSTRRMMSWGSWGYRETTPQFYVYGLSRNPAMFPLKRCRRADGAMNYALVAGDCPSGWNDDAVVGHVYNAATLLFRQGAGWPDGGFTAIYALQKSGTLMYTSDTFEYDRFLSWGWSPLNAPGTWNTICGLRDPNTLEARADLCAIATVWKDDVGTAL